MGGFEIVVAPAQERSSDGYRWQNIVIKHGVDLSDCLIYVERIYVRRKQRISIHVKVVIDTVDLPALRVALDEAERIAREWAAGSDGSEEAQS